MTTQPSSTTTQLSPELQAKLDAMLAKGRAARQAREADTVADDE